MQALISGTLDEAELLKKVGEDLTEERQCHLGRLPPLASVIAWLILSHHRMADKKAMPEQDMKMCAGRLSKVYGRV